MIHEFLNRIFDSKSPAILDGRSVLPEEEKFKRSAAGRNEKHDIHSGQLVADVAASKPGADQAAHKNAIQSSKDGIFAYMSEEGVPGLSICVSRRGQILWHSAFGFCDVENRLQCKPEARMRIASISKPIFVSTVIAPMIEQNKLDLDSSIYNYLTPQEFPRKSFAGKEVDITVEQLVTHTSGIRHYNEGKGTDLPFRPIGSAKSQEICQCDDQFNRTGFFTRATYRNVIAALEPFKDEPLESEPGTYRYSTYGYTLLSAVAEKAHQRAATDEKSKTEQIEDFWLKTLRRQWELHETSLDQDELILPNRARYYLRTAYNGRLINAPYADNSVKWAGGGLSSTTRDLVKFANLLIDCYKERAGAKLTRKTIDSLWKSRTGEYGMGFQIKKLNPQEAGGEKRAIYHLGGALGASSALIIYPDSELVVAILTNLGSTNPGKVGFHVANKFAQDVQAGNS